MNLKPLTRWCILGAFLTVAQGCMLKKKVERSVVDYYTRRNFILKTDSTSSIKLNTDSIRLLNGYCESHYRSFFTVPLIFYYYSKEHIQCDVNPMILVNSVVNGINTMAESEEYSEAFSGKEIELSFKRVPTTFYFKHHNQFFLPLLLPIPHMIWYDEKTEVYNPTDTIVLNFTVRDNHNHLPVIQGGIRQLLPGAIRTKDTEKNRKMITDYYSLFDDGILNAGDQIAKSIVGRLVENSKEREK